MEYKVKAECVDHRNGRRYMPGETFDPPPEKEQFERLKRAGVFHDPKAAEVSDQGQRTDEGEARRREEDAAAASHPVRVSADQEADQVTHETRERASAGPEVELAPSRETKPRRTKR